ncbi:hypothetical protein [Micromonospora sp. IBSANI012]|uniref:hypothetical protein n=1 Tax=Micromonospora sp. IBSANI012 TaxID=3457761 RepID=UPI004058B46C
MDEQPPHLVTSAADDPAGRKDVSQQAIVPLSTALRRWAVGLAIGTLLVLALSWIYSEGFLAILSALGFLHRQDDRRSRWAVGAAWLTAVPVALAAAAMLRGWLPQPWDGILFAGLGSLLGSVSYATVTQTGFKARQAGC